MKESELERKEKLLDEELELLTNEVMNLKLDHRADIDTLKLEIEALKLFLAQIYPDFYERFQALREKARLEISPEVNSKNSYPALSIMLCRLEDPG